MHSTCNQDRVGNNYAQQQLSSFQACINACAQDSQCLTAQYHESTGFCYLKNSIPSASSASGTDSVICGAAPSILSTSRCPSASTVSLITTSTITTTKTGSAATLSATQTITQPGTTVTSTVSNTATGTSTSTVVSASTLTLPAVTFTVTAITIASTSTVTVTSTTTTTDPSPTISGYNTPDSAGCLDGQLYVSGSDFYVQTCNVQFSGGDIPIGNAGFGPTNLDQCADLCEQTSGCVAAVYRTFPLDGSPAACFLKSEYGVTNATQGYDTVWKLATESS